MQSIKHTQLTVPSGSIPFSFREATSDETVIHRIFTVQDYSLACLSLSSQIDTFLAGKIAQGLRPLILDIGANIGASARYFLLNYVNSRVIALEPDPGNFELLSLNARGVDCIPVAGAIASEKGFARVCDPGLGHWGLRTEFDASGQVETFTIPELLHRYADSSFFPFIVKIDIEGAEAELFSKNIDWIDIFPVLIIELHDWMLPGTQNSRNFLSSIAGRARDFVYIGDNVFSIRTPLDGYQPACSPAAAVTSNAGS